MIVTGVTAEQMPHLYKLLEWAFESFAERSFQDCTPDELVGQVLAKTSQCWIAWDGEVRAVAMTEVKADQNEQKSVYMTHCAGNGREDWQEPMVNTIRDWAKSIGATTFGTVNRPGWTPFLRKMGLRETHRVMEQRIV